MNYNDTITKLLLDELQNSGIKEDELQIELLKLVQRLKKKDAPKISKEHAREDIIRSGTIGTLGSAAEKNPLYNTDRLEEVLFLVTDILHNASHNKIPIETIEDIMIKARLFTRYTNNSSDSNLLKTQDNFIKFLKNEMWVEVYGKSFKDFNSEEKRI